MGALTHWMLSLALSGAAEAASAPPVHLDPGGLGAPLQEGFSTLHPGGSDDPRVVWIDPGRPVDDGWPDDLARDGVVDARFTVELPDGAWLVAWIDAPGPLTMREVGPRPEGLRADGVVLAPADPPVDAAGFLASPGYARDPFPVFRPGETVWERSVLPEHGWQEARVVSKGGRVAFDTGGRPLRALAIWPWFQADEARASLGRVDAARRDRFVRTYDPEPAVFSPAPLLDAPPCLVPAPWGRDPADLPVTTPCAPPRLEAIVAPGERVAWPVWLQGDDAPATLRLTGDGPVDWVETYEIHWLDVAGAVGRPERPRPAFLRPTDGPLRGEQGVPVGLALAGTVPHDLPPGRHPVRLKVVRDGLTLDLTVDLTVVDVDLEDPPLPVGFFWRWPRWMEQLDGDDASAEARWREDVRWMRTWGADVWSAQDAAFLVADGIEPADRYDAMATAWDAAGGTHLFAWAMGGARPAFYDRDGALGPPLPDDLRPGLAALAGIGAGTELRVLHFLANEEEVKARDAIPQARAFAGAFRQAAAHPVQLAAGVANPAGWDLADAYDVVLLHDRDRGFSGDMARVAALGAEPWLYNVAGGRSGPWLAWGAEAQGLLQWQWSPDPGDPFARARSGAAYSYALPAPDGGTWFATKLASWSRGVSDLRWVATLEREIARLESSRRPAHRRLAAEARAFLDGVRGAVDGGATLRAWDGEALPPEALDALHDTLVSVTVRLTER